MRIGFLFLFIFAILAHHSAAYCGDHDGYHEYLADGSSNTSQITNTTEFQYNLGLALDQLYLNNTAISLYGWVGLYSGTGPNEAYSQARCIGYLDNYTCYNCIKTATLLLKEDCFKAAILAILWYGNDCMVQYSNHDLFSTVPLVGDDVILIKNNTGDVEPPSIVNAFNGARTKLFNVLSWRIQSSPHFFSAGKWYEGSSNETIYAAAQCTLNLIYAQCSSCLAIVSQKLGVYFDGKEGGSVVGPNCNFRYEVYNFMNDTLLVINDLSPPSPPLLPSPPQSVISATPLPPSPSLQILPPASTGGISNKLLVVYIVAPVVIVSIILFVVVCMFLRKKKHREPTPNVEIVERNSDEHHESSFQPDIKTEETLQYEFSTIRAATGNFSDANKLGRGGFGVVYKGKLRNGEEIAVKRLSQTSGQGEVEFTNEVTLLAQLQHRNLVRLLGFCLMRRERILIYEFVANSSLDNLIFDHIRRAHLNWDQFHKIIVGIARGLLYLHEDSRLRIIHRDLKSSNILLDKEMTPKIADFGMARLFLSDETEGNTSKIVGTYGYMAPEYALYGQFSIKSDVFSFGVILMEIICGRRNTFFRIENSVEDLLSYAWKNYQEGTIINLLDPTLRLETISTRDITRCIHIGLLCTQEDDTQRPTMASVFNWLNNLSIDLPIPSKPAFIQQRSIKQGTSMPQDYDSGQISNSSESKNKSSISWSTDTVLHPR